MCAGPRRLREFHDPNVNHAYPVADSFTLLKRGQSMGSFAKADISKEAVLDMMAGGAEMKKVMAELEGTGGPANAAVGVHRSALVAPRRWGPRRHQRAGPFDGTRSRGGPAQVLMNAPRSSLRTP